MVAWGQTKEHWPHWMQMSGSQTGMWVAMFLFSYWVVPVGQVPSSGMADTGSESPWPEMILAVTSLTNSGASRGTGGCIFFVLVAFFGTGTSTMLCRARSTAALFI